MHRTLIIVSSFFVCFAGSSAVGAVFNPYDFGSIGTLNPTTSVVFDTGDGVSTPTVTIDGSPAINGVIESSGARSVALFSFDDIDLGSGVTVSFSGSSEIALGLLSRDSILIDTSIDLSGQAGEDADGAAPIASGGAGGPGADGAGGDADGNVGEGLGGGGSSGSNGGGGGGGYGGEGGDGRRSGAAGGSTYGDVMISDLLGGSGGGGGVESGGSGVDVSAGGGGGGALYLGAFNTITLDTNAMLIVSGGAGGSGTNVDEAGGGGSGGAALLAATSVTLSGTIDAQGGNGGVADDNPDRSGGGGGGGRVAIYSDDVYGSTPAGVLLDGGTAFQSQSNGGEIGTFFDGDNPGFVIPEPTAAALIGLGAVALTIRRRQRA